MSYGLLISEGSSYRINVWVEYKNLKFQETSGDIIKNNNIIYVVWRPLYESALLLYLL